VRLELGSGYCPTEGFTHLDLNPNAPQVDIVGPAFPLDLPDGSCDEIRAVDVLEHLPYRQTAPALAEWARVLRSGGGLYIQVPDAAQIMSWYVMEPDRLLERLPADVPRNREGGAAWRLLGGQDDEVCARDGDDWRLNAHYALFSRDSLALALDEAGFVIDSIEVNGHPNLLCWSRKP
jgi:predicted SAM-dependent methyltransferase